ncbi:hypothetical protein [Mesorhizobium sp. M1329]|uniref:hypothetical protein n=1 Tax=Mesorhizobium sp. M1329 TaxID=2957083 RepID=UPI00333615AA
MNFLSKTDCESLIQRRLGGKGEDVRTLLTRGGSTKISDINRFYVSNRILSTYRIILEENSSAFDECIAFFDSIGVWPYQQDEKLSQLLWRHYTRHFPAERPGIVFSRFEFEKIYAFFCVSFYSGWDSALIFNEFNWIYFSHDEYMLCRFEDKSIEDFLKK